jgi:hypothetical protein
MAYRDDPEAGTGLTTADATRPDRAVRCRQCGAEITSQRHAIDVGGKHDHTFFNPAGIIFEIGCYGRADGCRVVGPPTTEFSWFAGQAWSYALCNSCQSHLGWFFEPAAASVGFFGLIHKKLVVEEG